MRQTLQEWAGVKEGQGTQLSLVLTDVVGSTTMAQKLGDKNWINIISPHFRQAHKLAAEHGGFVIKLIGDACMVAFKSSINAFNFAVEFYVDPGHPDLGIRAAINTGHVYMMGDDTYGMMVNLTARIQKLIPEHGIMVSRSVASDLQNAFGKDSPGLSIRISPKEIPDFGGERAYWVATRETRMAGGERLKRVQAAAQSETTVKAALPARPQASSSGIRPRVTPPKQEWARRMFGESTKADPTRETDAVNLPLPERPKKDPS